ncbi:MAG: S8 family serine peptidase, partial [Planctomycetota bacterium]|nr:S8 family serine peptidase [Planctomycetota bacterium]
MPSRTTTLLATLLLAWVVHSICPPQPRGPVEPWIVLFESRSFDLREFRTAVRGNLPAETLATITDGLAERARSDQEDFCEALSAIGGRVRQQWWLINGCAVDIPAGTSQALLALPRVASIEPDSGFQPGGHRTSEDPDHRVNEVHRRGYTGEGVGLAIMDTGQDANCNGTNRPHSLYFPHGNPANTTGKGIAGSRLERNLQLGAMPAEDVTGHGTAVAALAAGAAWGPQGARPGHAPGASIAGYAIAEQPDGTSAVSTVISAWQAISADRQAYRLVGANNSYGGSPDPLSAAQRALDSAAYNADLLVTVCAYNTGLSGTSHSQSACNGLSVGAVAGDSHEVTNYSARGPLHRDRQRTYPDLCAISSTIGPNADCEASAGPWFGTSFAAPRVLGAAGVLRQAEPALTALETKAILLASTADLQPQNQQLGRNGPGVGLLRDDLALATALDPTLWTTVTLDRPGVVRLPIAVRAGEPTSVAINWHRQRF